MNQYREYNDGEEIEVGDVVYLGDWAFSTAIVVKVEGDWVHLERPHMDVKSIGCCSTPQIMLERFTTGKNDLRVYMRGSKEKDNRNR